MSANSREGSAGHHHRHLIGRDTETTDVTPTASAIDAASQLLYTPSQAAELLAVKESWLRRKAGRRAIPCTFLGKHLRFSHADLRSLIAASAQDLRPARRQRRR